MNAIPTTATTTANASAVLKESDVICLLAFLPAMSPGLLITLDYGGLIYDMLYNDHILALRVAPAIESPSPSEKNSTSSSTSTATAAVEPGQQL